MSAGADEVKVLEAVETLERNHKDIVPRTGGSLPFPEVKKNVCVPPSFWDTPRDPQLARRSPLLRAAIDGVEFHCRTELPRFLQILLSTRQGRCATYL